MSCRPVDVNAFNPVCGSLVRSCVHQEILNHCFDDVERFMGRLQQTAEAQTILSQKKKKGSKKSKKGNQDSKTIFFLLL